MEVSFNPHIQKSSPFSAPLSEKKSFEQHAELETKFLTTNREVKHPLKRAELHEVFVCYEKFLNLKKKWKRLTLSQIGETAKTLRESGNLKAEEALALGSRALYKLFRIDPYETQIIAVLASLLPKKRRGRLAQAKTGEGKSIIIALQALVIALSNQSVHLISSSHFLAQRDQKKYQEFFKTFGITTGHICDHQPEKCCFDHQILYGMATDFEFALMREQVDGVSLFRKDSFHAAIVDEVDNLVIDTAMNSARIARPSLDQSKKDLLKAIFAWVSQSQTPMIQDLSVSKEQLQTYLSFARVALIKQENIDYVVQEQQETSSIVIIDRENTGRLCHGMRWGQGLHEFVELKHGIPLGDMSTTPISMSHAVFYDHYERLFGFSGTLGSDIERSEICEIYDIDTFDVPPHSPCIRIDGFPRIFKVEGEYREALKASIRERQKEGRPILVLTSSIHESLECFKILNEFSPQLFNEAQEASSQLVIDQAGKPGALTIATNNAGRGTDIEVEVAAQKVGGLHVILTHYPSSKRVEDQGIGRAGRQGQPGSSEILALEKDQTLEGLKLWRDSKEVALSLRLKNRAQAERLLVPYGVKFWTALKERRESLEQRVLSFSEEHQSYLEEEQKVQIWGEHFWEKAEEIILEERDVERGLQNLFQGVQKRLNMQLKS